MELDRSTILDLGLGLGVGVCVFVYQTHTSPGARWFNAAFVGLAVLLLARFVLRRIFNPAQPPYEQAQADLQALEALLENDQLPSEERAQALEHAGAIAMMLENWPRAIVHHRAHISILEEVLATPFEQDEEDRRFLQMQHWQSQFALGFALYQNEQQDASLVQLERLRATLADADLPTQRALDGDEEEETDPMFPLLVEMFYARVLSHSDPEQSRALIQQALALVREAQHEEEALHLIAFEWLEMDAPKEAIALLEQALTLAQERNDNQAQVESRYHLAYAYAAAGDLPNSAELFTTLIQSYLYTDLPSAEQLDELRSELHERFGHQVFQEALERAEQRTNLSNP